MSTALAAFAVLLTAQTAPSPPRHFLGESAFSFASDGELKLVRTEDVDGRADWMIKVTDWEIDAKDLYIAASKFEGRAGTKVDRPFLSNVISEFVTGMEGDKDVATITLRDETKIDTQLAQRTNYRIGTGKDAMYVQSVFLASGTDLYSLIAVYFQESGAPADAAKRLMDSVRFKKPLTDTDQF